MESPWPFEQFLRNLDGSNSSNESVQRDSMSFLMQCQHQSVYNYLFDACRAMHGQEYGLNVTINALCAIKYSILPQKSLTIEKIQSDWFSDQFEPVRAEVKSTLLCMLSNTEISVRNLVSACIALVLQIELDKWTELFPTLIKLCSPDGSSIDTIHGVITTVEEIFCLPIFTPSIDPNHLPIELNQIRDIIVFAIGTVDVSDQIAISASSCLYRFIKAVPIAFSDPGVISSIFNAIFARLPSASVQLYRSIHFIVLQLVKTLYPKSSEFIENVFNITTGGINCPNRELVAISIDLWNHIAVFEENYYEENKSKIIIEPSLYPAFCVTASNILVNIILNQFMAMDLESSNFDDSSSSQLIQVSKDLLVHFFNANSEFTFSKIYEYVSFLDSYNVKGSMCAQCLAMQGLCGQQPLVKAELFLTSRLESVVPLFKDECQLLAALSIGLVSSIIRSYPRICCSNVIAPRVFAASFDLIQAPIFIASKMVALLTSISETFPQPLLDTYFEEIFGTLFQATKSPSFLVSDEIGLPYQAMAVLFNRVTRKSYRRLLTICSGLSSELPSMFDSFTDAKWFYVQQDNFLNLLARLFNVLRDEASEFAPAVFSHVLVLLEREIFEVFEEAIQLLSILVYLFGDIAIRYQPRIFSALNRGLGSRNPMIIGHCAAVYGSFFATVKEQGSHLFEEPLTIILPLLEDPSVDNQKDYYEAIVRAVGEMILGLRESIPMDVRQRYVEKLILLSQTVFNKNRIEEMEETVRLFEVVSYGFFCILEAYSSDTEMVSVIRSKLFRFFDYVWKTKAFDESSLWNLISLAQKLGSILGREFNIQMNRDSVKCLLNEASKSRGDSKLRSYANKVRSDLERL